jgi:SAM-dependent methyltransferase
MMSSTNTELRIDLGCGAVKKEGTIGLDYAQLPTVDYVLNLETDPLPFADRSVAYVHSSHFLEHTKDPGHALKEVSRVCADGARLEFWTPYVWSGDAFVMGHTFYWAEEIYLHMCVKYYDYWAKQFDARWILNEFQYVIDAQTLIYLQKQNLSLDTGIRYYHDVVREFCAHITVRRDDLTIPAPAYRRTFSAGHRFAPRYEIKVDRLPDVSDKETDRAVRHFAEGNALPPY